MLDASSSGLTLGSTVVQARPRAAVAADHRRPIHFRGRISAPTNGTSPPLRGSFGDGSAPAYAGFVASDADNADVAYGPFDVLSLVFTMPTDRAALAVTSGDKRWVDEHFDFTCSLGLNYSGTWDDPRSVDFVVLDGTIGLSPLATTNLADIRVTPARSAAVRAKPDAGTDSTYTPSAVLEADPPLRGSHFPRRGGAQIFCLPPWRACCE